MPSVNSSTCVATSNLCFLFCLNMCLLYYYFLFFATISANFIILANSGSFCNFFIDPDISLSTSFCILSACVDADPCVSFVPCVSCVLCVGCVVFGFMVVFPSVFPADATFLPDVLALLVYLSCLYL